MRLITRNYGSNDSNSVLYSVHFVYLVKWTPAKNEITGAYENHDVAQRSI